ncbi:hypothetical protein AOLI_G00128060, partial [Acnodon oligacanthus]
ISGISVARALVDVPAACGLRDSATQRLSDFFPSVFPHVSPQEFVCVPKFAVSSFSSSSPRFCFQDSMLLSAFLSLRLEAHLKSAVRR